MPKVNQFDITMPLNPHDPGGAITMNGKRLEGVTAFVAKAGDNGFSNIAMEFEASYALSMTAAFIPTIKKDPVLMLKIGELLIQELPECVDREEYGEAFLKVLERMIEDLA